MYIVFSCTTWNDEWVPFARLGWGRFFGTFSPGDKADAADGTAQEEIDAAKATKICQSMATGNLNRTVPGLLGGTQILLNLCNKYISYICIECICIYIYIQLYTYKMNPVPVPWETSNCNPHRQTSNCNHVPWAILFLAVPEAFRSAHKL